MSDSWIRTAKNTICEDFHPTPHQMHHYAGTLGKQLPTADVESVIDVIIFTNGRRERNTD